MRYQIEFFHAIFAILYTQGPDTQGQDKAARTKMNATMPIAMLQPDPMNSLADGSFTFHWDKYSCIKEMYEAHGKCGSSS